MAEQVDQVDVGTAAQLLEDGAAVVDVREPEEFATGHVPGAVNIPMGQVHRRLGELDRSRRQLVVCRSGNRSGAITDVLVARGFDALNVAGGTLAWEREGRPLEHPAVPDLTVRVIETPSLGDRSYLVHDGRVALVVDPQRDIDRVLDLLAADGERLALRRRPHHGLGHRPAAVQHVQVERLVGVSHHGAGQVQVSPRPTAGDTAQVRGAAHLQGDLAPQAPVGPGFQVHQ